MTSVWPRRWDPVAVEAWFRLYRATAGATLDRVEAGLRRHLPELEGGGDHRALAELHARVRIEDMWGRLRGLRWRGFKPDLRVEGLEHLRAALERGRGVVVWCMRVGSATALMQGFFRAGFPLTHLSRFDHGSRTTTRLGVGVVAPFYRRAEDAFLAERVRIPRGDSLAYLRTLEARLAANRCVSLFGEHPGRQSIELPVLGIPRRFARGAPSIAWRTGAGLLTAHVVREGVFRYRVVIEEEIAVDTSTPRRRFAEQAVGEYARRLERCVRRHPAEWQAWFYSGAAEPA